MTLLVLFSAERVHIMHQGTMPPALVERLLLLQKLQGVPEHAIFFVLNIETHLLSALVIAWTTTSATSVSHYPSSGRLDTNQGLPLNVDGAPVHSNHSGEKASIQAHELRHTSLHLYAVVMACQVAQLAAAHLHQKEHRTVAPQKT
jgi:hypothetical protein